jgi:hypothetical protein
MLGVRPIDGDKGRTRFHIPSSGVGDNAQDVWETCALQLSEIVRAESCAQASSEDSLTSASRSGGAKQWL